MERLIMLNCKKNNGYYKFAIRKIPAFVPALCRCVGQFFSGSFEQRAGKVQVVKKRKGGGVLRVTGWGFALANRFEWSQKALPGVLCVSYRN